MWYVAWWHAALEKSVQVFRVVMPLVHIPIMRLQQHTVNAVAVAGHVTQIMNLQRPKLNWRRDGSFRGKIGSWVWARSTILFVYQHRQQLRQRSCGFKPHEREARKGKHELWQLLNAQWKGTIRNDYGLLITDYQSGNAKRPRMGVAGRRRKIQLCGM